MHEYSDLCSINFTGTHWIRRDFQHTHRLTHTRSRTHKPHLNKPYRSVCVGSGLAGSKVGRQGSPWRCLLLHGTYFGFLLHLNLIFCDSVCVSVRACVPVYWCECVCACAKNLLSLSQRSSAAASLALSQGNFFGVLMPFGYQLAIIRWILEPGHSSDGSFASSAAST